MPSSPEADLNKINDESKSALEKEGAKNITFEEKPIAFGLKAIMIKFIFPEEKGTDLVESLLSKIPDVSSVAIEDYRRSLG